MIANISQAEAMEVHVVEPDAEAKRLGEDDLLHRGGGRGVFRTDPGLQTFDDVTSQRNEHL
jgi:hypothetical protein